MTIPTTVTVQALEQLSKLPNFPQRSTQWFNQRTGRITASEAASCIRITTNMLKTYYSQFPNAKPLALGACGNPYSSYEHFMQRKVDPANNKFLGNEATRFGTFYEPIACQYYSQINDNAVVNEYGFIQHPTYEFLGASPDGITDKGIMLEIKCPLRRNINGVPPFYYFVQMQLQLECCNLQYCDYLECKFIQTKDITQVKKDLNCFGTVDTNKNIQPMILTNIGPPDFYYYLDTYYISRVQRDPDFFNECLDQFKEAHKDWMTRLSGDAVVETEQTIDPTLQFTF